MDATRSSEDEGQEAPDPTASQGSDAGPSEAPVGASRWKKAGGAIAATQKLQSGQADMGNMGMTESMQVPTPSGKQRKPSKGRKQVQDARQNAFKQLQAFCKETIRADGAGDRGFSANRTVENPCPFSADKIRAVFQEIKALNQALNQGGGLVAWNDGFEVEGKCFTDYEDACNYFQKRKWPGGEERAARLYDSDGARQDSFGNPGSQYLEHALDQWAKENPLEACATDQEDFLDSFCKCIVEEVVPPEVEVEPEVEEPGKKKKPVDHIIKVLENFDPRHLLLVSMDLKRLEVRVSPTKSHEAWEKITQWVINFMADLGAVEADTEAQYVEQVVAMTKARDCCVPKGETVDAKGVSTEPQAIYTEVEFWCVLDHIGDLSKASVDAGFTFWWTKPTQSLRWCAVDMMLPASDDKERFLEFAMNEKPPLVPTCYTSSFFSASASDNKAGAAGGTEKLPREPAHSMRGLQLELPRSPQATFLGLMVFKEMGFVKPKNKLFKNIIELDQRGAYVGVNFGPKGLTRLFLRFFRTGYEAPFKLRKLLVPEDEWQAKEAAFVRICNLMMPLAVQLEKEKHVQEGGDPFDYTPEIIEYAAEARGFTVSVGFTG